MNQFIVKSKLCGQDVWAIIDQSSSRKWISRGLLERIEDLSKHTFTHVIMHPEIMIDGSGVNWMVSSYIRVVSLLTGLHTKFYILEIKDDLLILNDKL